MSLLLSGVIGLLLATIIVVSIGLAIAFIRDYFIPKAKDTE